ncbi:hypothetical protein A3Q56_02863 [Intoshia linei]|uniref:Pentatricopeptide repeat-containing protein 1, mitochondrial n=1 Tax=Intoshia linei TaxID=1819745 RepID=A0A177B4W7_9BILA|nr:hypothetical protein A3Q56_02863 [Intoshia linei]
MSNCYKYQEIIEKNMENGDLIWQKRFGTLLPNKTTNNFKILKKSDSFDEEKAKNVRYLKTNKKSEWFAFRIKNCIKKGDFDLAEEIYNHILKTEPSKIREHLFILMIDGYSKSGNLIKCKSFFDEMKNRNFKPTVYAYSSMFHACFKSNYKKLASSVCNELKNEIKEKNIKPHIVVYNNMMKAFARVGNFEKSLSTINLIRNNQLQFDYSSYCHLFLIASMDRQCGFRLLIRVLMILVASDVKFTHSIFHSMLKAVQKGGGENASYLKYLDYDLPIRRLSDGSQDCVNLDSGLEKENKSLNLQNISQKSDIQQISFKSIQSVDNFDDVNSLNILNVSTHQLIGKSQDIRKTFHKICIHATELFDSDINFNIPHNRLAIFGGWKGILKVVSMKQMNMNIKILTMILNCLNQDGKDEFIDHVHKYYPKLIDDDFVTLSKIKRVDESI